MSRKTTFIVIIVLIILGVAAWWFFSRENSTTPANQPTQTNQNLFPYGQNATSSVNQPNNNSNQGTVFINTSSTSLPALIHITMTPVSGYIFLPEGKNSTSSPQTTTLRYIDRATGHIDDYSFDTGTSTEVTNTTIPKVYQGSFAGGGARAYLQTIDENNQIETLSASVPLTEVAGPVALTNVTFLPKNIISLATHSNSLFYLIPTTNGSAGYESNLDGTKSLQVMSSGLSELVSGWQSATITLATKPSSLVGGYFFDLNTKTGNLSPVLRNISGLTALENSLGTFVFGSSSRNGTVQSFMYNEKTGATRILSLETLANKCVWSVKDTNIIYCAVPSNISGTLPDDWYQGNIFLSSDTIWKIAADTGITNIVDFLSTRNQNIDATNLVLDGNEKWLSFTDKEDLTLWALRLPLQIGQ